MEYAYFKADKEITDDYFKTWKKTQVAVQKKEKEIIDKYKSDGLYRMGKSIIGLVFEGHNLDDRRGFIKESIKENGKPYTIFKPNKRFNEGKAFAELTAEYSHISNENPDFSDFIINALQVGRSLIGSHAESRTGMALYSSVAGVSKGMLIVQIPIDEESPAPDEIPQMKRIKKSEFIAITEE